MDRETLAAMLEEGRSIESIARETGRAASTVAYWVNKHGLVSRHASKHAARGGIERAELQALVEEGLPIRADRRIARRVSYTTVRHWMAEVRTLDAARARLAETATAPSPGADPDGGELSDPRAGRRSSASGDLARFRCARCNTEAVQRRRRDVKRILVAEAGGRMRAVRVRRVSLGGAALPSPSIRRRKPSRSAARESRDRSQRLAWRRPSACYCARTATRMVEAGTLVCPSRYCSEAGRSPAPHSGVAQSAEHSAVNRRVVGSNPTPRASSRAACPGGSRRL